LILSLVVFNRKLYNLIWYPMNDKLLLKLTVTQRKLLLDYRAFIMNEDITRAISVSLRKSNKYLVYLDEDDFEDLIGHVCAIANHAENDSVANKFHKLADYFEDCFEKFK